MNSLFETLNRVASVLIICAAVVAGTCYYRFQAFKHRVLRPFRAEPALVYEAEPPQEIDRTAGPDGYAQIDHRQGW